MAGSFTRRPHPWAASLTLLLVRQAAPPLGMPFLAAIVSLTTPPLFRKGTAAEGAVKYVLEGYTYAKVRRHIPLEAMRGLRAAGALGGAGPYGHVALPAYLAGAYRAGRAARAGTRRPFAAEGQTIAVLGTPRSRRAEKPKSRKAEKGLPALYRPLTSDWVGGVVDLCRFSPDSESGPENAQARHNAPAAGSRCRASLADSPPEPDCSALEALSSIPPPKRIGSQYTPSRQPRSVAP